MKKKLYLFGFLAAVICGCTADPGLQQVSSDVEGGYRVIHPRSTALTTQVSKDLVVPMRSLNGLDDLNDDSPYRYIGYGYKAGNGIIGDPTNLTYPLVDIDGLLADELLSDNISRVSVRSANAEVFAFSNYEEYLSSSSHTKKISTNFPASLLQFRFGFDLTYENTFRSQMQRSKQQMKGIVNLFYKESNVKLNTTAYSLEKIREKHISRSFLGSLYNSSINDVINNYGGYVVCDYAVGGRATATYLYNYSESNDSIARDFSNVLSLSVGWGKKGADSSIGFKVEGSKEEMDKQAKTYKEIYNKINVVGGDPAFTISTPVASVTDNTVDLSNWLTSLVSREKLVMVDINSRGLVGLDNFVLEENYKGLIRDINEGLSRPGRLSIPHFTIQWVSVWDGRKSKKIIAAVLDTRNGDKVIFASPSTNNANLSFNSEKKRLTADIQRVFRGIEVGEKPGGILNPLVHARYSCVVLPCDIDELHCKKYTNPATRVTYAYNPEKHIAFSLYSEEYIPEVYGLAEWMNSLPQEYISMSMLSKFYTIIGL